MVRFYSYPPKGVTWPWILRTQKQKERPYKHEIIDAGFYDLLNPPHQYSQKRLQAWQNLVTPGWKTVPDCPDLQGEFKVAVDFDTQEYSWDLLTRFYDPEDRSHLPVIQGRYEDANSFLEYAKKLKKEYGEPPQIAIGTLCKSNSIQIVEEGTKLIRKLFPFAFIHGFGLKMHHLARTWMYIDSYDSSAWTWPRNNGSGSGRRPQATTKKEKIQYFTEYTKQISKYCDPYQENLREVLKKWS